MNLTWTDVLLLAVAFGLGNLVSYFVTMLFSYVQFKRSQKAKAKAGAGGDLDLATLLSAFEQEYAPEGEASEQPAES